MCTLVPSTRTFRDCSTLATNMVTLQDGFPLAFGEFPNLALSCRQTAASFSQTIVEV